MSYPRIKIKQGGAIYHCMNRTIHGHALFSDKEKATFQKMLFQVAAFSGVELLTYAVMDNHFHVLVRVPDRALVEATITDAVLVERYDVLYPHPTPQNPMDADALAKLLAEGGPTAEAMRARLLKRMHDVSAFMQTLKQRYTVYYNSSHNTYGTLWANRFKSVLVENSRNTSLIVGAYIDLNPVRAEMVADPKDYPFCGYGAATAGYNAAVDAIQRLLGQTQRPLPWAELIAEYRKVLFGKGVLTKRGKPQAGKLDSAQAAEILHSPSGAQLGLYDLFRCRLRFMSKGGIIGSANFVRFAGKDATRRKNMPPIPLDKLIPIEFFEDLASFRL